MPAADGSLRTDVDPLDVTAGILPLLGTTAPDDRARRLLTLFVDGLRRAPAEAAGPESGPQSRTPQEDGAVR